MDKIEKKPSEEITCSICGEKVTEYCLCGYCDKCVEKHTHSGCFELYRKQRALSDFSTFLRNNA